MKKEQKYYRAYDIYLRKKIKNQIEFYHQYDVVKIPKTAKILDFGCGTGMFIKYMLNKSPKNVDFFGCDINPISIKANRQDPSLRGVNFKLLKPDQRLPYPDNYFDLVYLLDVIEHTTEPLFMLQEIGRILKKRGKIVLNTPDRFSIILDPIFYKGKNIISFNLKRLMGKDFLDYTHVKEFSYQELVSLIMKTRLRIISQNKPTFLYSLPFLHRGSLLLVLEK